MQSPGYTQSYNRYSYVWNNPLRYTDPTGYSVYTLDENTVNVPYIAGGSGFAANWYSVLTSRGVVPGSGKHWSDALHGEGVRNLMLMNSDEYISRFGKESYYMGMARITGQLTSFFGPSQDLAFLRQVVFQ